MGYAAMKGGLEAIRAAEELVRRKRRAVRGLDTAGIRSGLRLAVDRVQGEGALWAPDIAVRAVRQAEGDLIEASQLVRSYRSTLPRLAYSETTHVDELRILRRIVPAYRTPPGPQLLGRTLDYTGRLIEFGDVSDGNGEAPAADDGDAERRPGRLLEVLRKQGLLVDRRPEDASEPFDITRRPLPIPAPRPARLAALARGETGALVNLWYQNIHGPRSALHELTLGEVRHGRLPVRVAHPRTGHPVEIGQVGATEVEAVEDVREAGGDRDRFDAGYGLVLGHNERKAIAMAALDVAIERDRGRTSLEQSVLRTCDGLDASGFLEHLKLPHYVTFRSMVERKLAVRRKTGERAEGRR